MVEWIEFNAVPLGDKISVYVVLRNRQGNNIYKHFEIPKTNDADKVVLECKEWMKKQGLDNIDFYVSLRIFESKTGK